jgi:hypothetical protein
MAVSVEQIRQSIPGDTKVTEQEVKEIEAAVREIASYQEMVDLTAGLLAKYYTLDEIHQLAAFYKSPLGQKSMRIMPDLMRDSMGAMQATDRGVVIPSGSWTVLARTG